MIHTNKLAQDNSLTRRLLNISNQEGQWQCQVEIANTVRSELMYVFVEGTASRSQACMAAVDRATELFLGVSSQVAAQVEKQVEQQIKKEEAHEESKQENVSSKSENVAEKQKRQRKSTAKKDEVKETEEMEEVPSPFVDKNYIAFDKESKELKASLATLLTKLHQDAHPDTDGKQWKTRDDLKSKSAFLHDKPFIHAKDGSIHPEFVELCKVGFGLDSDGL